MPPKQKKVFVLDTSVILYSHDSILNFAEHDVGIPITVLEELDTFKKGNDTKNFEAREFTRRPTRCGPATSSRTSTISIISPTTSRDVR